MTNNWPDEVVHFSARTLLQPTVPVMWRLPYEVSDAVEDLDPDVEMNHADWREHVIIPLFRDVIIPALPMSVDVNYVEAYESRSPIVTVRIDGNYVPVAADEAVALVQRLDADEHRLTLPAVFLAEVLLGAQSIQSLVGVPLPLLTLAFAAGIRPTEVRTQYTAGTLTERELSLMVGLRS